MDPPAATRKQRGAWYTHSTLITEMIGWISERVAPVGPPLRIVDPSCGDGRLLLALRDAFPQRSLTLVGCEIDAAAAAATHRHGIDTICDDALAHNWEFGTFDIVIGNPPFLSQLASETSRGGSSRFGGGPYANSAAEFAELSVRLARPDGGLIALVLPQSVLGARDTEAIRASIDRAARRVWSWWEPEQDYFDASVHVCMIGWQRPATDEVQQPWTTMITERLGVPTLPARLDATGTVADRCAVSADFRDQYYGLIPAVGDHRSGPPLVTSGLIDPGRCCWGERPVRFNKQRFAAPRVDLNALVPSMRAWADIKLVPKVLVANQTRVIEAVCDHRGEWIPSVPVISAIPFSDQISASQVAAVLGSPLASAWVWHRAGGTGLSASSVRIAPRHLGAVPWPNGALTDAAAAVDDGRLVDAGRLVLGAYGLEASDQAGLMEWWTDRLDRTQRPRPRNI